MSDDNSNQIDPIEDTEENQSRNRLNQGDPNEIKAKIAFFLIAIVALVILKFALGM